jgi:peptidoglycan/LPS O-acetylase OafA/YrhL
MVIACHLAYQYPGLPWPVKRVVTSGWFGVQLFFLASCLTLLMSWHSEVLSAGKVSLVSFFIRRFFRIAPAYYAAGLFYYFITAPKSGFDLWHALESATFINAWTPTWMPTVAGGWAVVPGGWSISVEFAFYVIFPVFASFTTSLRRSLQVLGMSVAMGLVANLLTFGLLQGAYNKAALSNFLFFWFPDQASVFALGGVMFFMIRDEVPAWLQAARNSDALALISIGVFWIMTYLPLGHYLGDRPLVPAGLAACFPLMTFVIALSKGNSIFVNRLAGSIGKVSFSAYLLHFAVLQVIRSFPSLFQTTTVGFKAIFACCLGFIATASLTYFVSCLSYRLIEQPMVAFGRRLSRRSRQQIRLT